MSAKTSKSVATRRSSKYEFGGPFGVLGLSVALPLLCYLATFLCNDVAGCPIPSVLHPTVTTWKQLKQEAGWPADGLAGLASFRATAWTLGYYGLSLLMQLVLPGEEFQGVELRSGGRLTYKFNALNSAIIILTAAFVGTLTEGADFALWTFIWENYVQILTANLAIAFILACYVYVQSFSVRAENSEHRELAAGGHTGNLVYDWFIGRELNPRIQLPFFDHVDIKEFCELRPGMLGWVLLDLCFVAHQYKTYGYVTDSIVLITVFQSIYVLDSLWNEPAVLTTMDITTDGFGFMLAFGDLVWLPFIYSLQTRYLATHPVHLGLYRTLAVLTFQAIGYYIFRSANSQKHHFRTNPNDPRVAHLESIRTASGSRLLVSGWWGVARHINYLGDWIMAWAWCLPTGIAGYIIQHRVPATFPGGTTFPTEETRLVQAEARGWGMIFTYFYLLYFAILLVHRAGRDEEKCQRKYGADWDEYRKRVPWRIIPGLY